jgi:inorganic pyrophosphatase
MRLDALRVGHHPPDDVNVVVERLLYTSARCPGNYGFVPRAPCGDAEAASEVVWDSIERAGR